MKSIILPVLIFVASMSEAQIIKSEKSYIKFYSDGLIEDITATNKKATALLDMKTGEVAFSVPIAEFMFDKNLMKQHFNEKYMETEKYPKSTFEGKLNGFNATSKNVQNVVAVGKLQMHGVTNEVSIPGTIELTQDNKALMKAKFMVKLADYKIKIPSVVFQNIAEEVEVTVEFTLK